MTLQQFLGIDLPIIQAPMAGSQGSALAVAGFCHPPPRPDPEREASWRNSLAACYAEFGLVSDPIPPAPARALFSAEAAEVLEEFKPAVVSFHFGLPAPHLLARVWRWGAKVLSTTTTVAEARWLEAHGADAIIAQGLEAGGHRGMFLTEDLSTQVGTMALVPQGGARSPDSGDCRRGHSGPGRRNGGPGTGCRGVQVGTAYLLCPEALTNPLHRAALQAETSRHTALTNLFTGRPARSIVNRFIREHGPLNPAAPAFPLAAGAVAPLRARTESQGSRDFSPL